MQKILFSLLVGIAALAAIPREAKAVTATTEIFAFSGTCSDCAGFGTGTLTLQNYTPGNDLSANNSVSFVYHSSLVPNLDITSVIALIGEIGPSTGCLLCKLR